MIQITLQDGMTYKGNNPHDLITQLKLEDWTPYASPQEYKKNISRRVRIFKGEPIQYGNDLEFLQELERVGFIKNIKTDKTRS